MVKLQTYIGKELWWKGEGCPRESDIGIKLNIKGAFGDMSWHWKYKDKMVEADPNFMTIFKA